MDPPDSFKLDLRAYQKQALQWMVTMEGGEEDARQSLSLHPLYEEYHFPPDPNAKEAQPTQSFYYSPYSGELTLKFPKASKKCRGGILADGEWCLASRLGLTSRSRRDGLGQDHRA